MLRLFNYLTIDLFGTCIFVKKPFASHYTRVAASYGVNLLDSKIDPTFRHIYSTFSNNYPNYGLAQGLSSAQWWYQVTSYVINNSSPYPLSATLRDKICNALYEEFKTERCWSVQPAALELLKICKQKSLPVIGISNMDERLDDIISKLDLKQYFQYVLSRAAKPDSKKFNEILRTSNFNPSETCHIGNNIKEDILPALSLGLQTVLISGSEDNTKSCEEKLSMLSLNATEMQNISIFSSLDSVAKKLIDL